MVTQQYVIVALDIDPRQIIPALQEEDHYPLFSVVGPCASEKQLELFAQAKELSVTRPVEELKIKGVNTPVMVLLVGGGAHFSRLRFAEDLLANAKGDGAKVVSEFLAQRASF